MPNKTPAAGALPSNIVDLVQLFSEHEAELRFPDVDLPRLEAAVTAVGDADAEVASAEAALERAREGRARRQAELSEVARRAHAYASVYSDGNDELATRLRDIKAPSAPKRAKKKTAPTKAKTKAKAKAESTAAGQSADTAESVIEPVAAE